MNLTVYQKEAIQRQFDCFCKKVLREEARDYIRSLKRLAEHEVSFNDLSEIQISQFYLLDEYPSDFTVFFTQGEIIQVKNDRLAEAIATLSPEKQRIVLLFYFLDMTDREIGEHLNIARSTVQYKRIKSLKEIKKEMEERF